MFSTIYRDSTNLGTSNGMAEIQTASADDGGNSSFFGGNYLDSPATTSSTTYQFYFKRGAGGNSAVMNYDSTRSSITVFEIKG